MTSALPRLPLVALALLLCLGTGLPGCVAIAEEPVLDEDGEPVPVPAPFDRWLQVERVLPSDEVVGPRPTIVLRFADYLQDDVLLDYATVFLSSGGLRAYGRTRHVVSQRALVFEPFRDLEQGLVWSLQVDPSRLESVTGAPPQIASLPSYRVVDAGSAPPRLPPGSAPGSGGGGAPSVPRAGWEEVEAILARKCFSCHRDPTWGLNPLRPASLVGVDSEQVDRYLVRPFDPADSYLLQKVLPDYPMRRFTVQPPPWSQAEPLDEAELLTIEGWIDAGAPS